MLNAFATPLNVRYVNWSGGSVALIMNSFKTLFYCRIVLFDKTLCLTMTRNFMTIKLFSQL